MTQNFFIHFLTYEYEKYAEFYADFRSVEIIRKKMHPQKVICQKLLQISSIEEGKDKFSTLVLPITFF